MIPTLPEELHLRRTLESIISEIERSDRRNCEILVIVKDVGIEPPDSVKVLERKYDYVKLYRLKGDLSTARNEGIRRSKNQIMAFVDADTEIGENFVDQILEHFGKGYGYVNFSARPVETDKMRYYFYSKLMCFFQWFFTHVGICMPYGFCVSAHRDILEKIKVDGEFFRSSYALIGEDAEFGRRYGRYCRENRIRGKYEPGVKVLTSFRRVREIGFWNAAQRTIRNCLSPYLV